MELLLLRAQLNGYFHLRAADFDRVVFFAEYSAKCVAQIQARGMYIDMSTWNAVQENNGAVVAELLRQIGPELRH